MTLEIFDNEEQEAIEFLAIFLECEEFLIESLKEEYDLKKVHQGINLAFSSIGDMVVENEENNEKMAYSVEFSNRIDQEKKKNGN